jgi:hypothetical protein
MPCRDWLLQLDCDALGWGNAFAGRDRLARGQPNYRAAANR